MAKTLSTSNSKIPIAFLIALGICLFFRFGDLFFSPTTFTHRLWETLLVHHYGSELPGPFYPNQKKVKLEQGDLAPYTHYSVKKPVLWQTDSWGYRTNPSTLSSDLIVIVGDSTTVGTGMDQTQILSEKLKETGLNVYPFAPYYEMDTYFQSEHLKKHPPQQVVFSMMEWALPDLAEVRPLSLSNNHFALKLLKKSLSPENYQKIIILMDRASKQSMMRFLNARVKGFVKDRVSKPPFQVVVSPQGNMIFPGGKSAHPELSEKILEKIIPVLQRYQAELKKRNIPMIFLPVPNKETLYHDLFSTGEAPRFYPALIAACEQAGIPTVDLLTVYKAVKFKNSEKLLYQLDDSHWNARGVKVAAQALAPKLKEFQKDLS